MPIPKPINAQIMAANNRKIYCRCIFLWALLLEAGQVFSQSTLLSLSGTYGIVSVESPGKSIDRRTGGLQTGLEYRFRKKFSFGAELDWQSIGVYPETVSPVSPASSKPSVTYEVKTNQLSGRILARYYIKKSLKGFYIGVFGNFSFHLTDTNGYPEDGAYPARNNDFSDHIYRGGGLTYGYRFQLTPKAGGHLSLSHQRIWNNNNPDFIQTSHRAGIGLQYIF
ncbi:MAG TPA: hypothetical protein VK168_11750 [Saprospiraceae bacterium]|nr:hypothetical protein [Saprospiraceae bacterium]